MFVIVLPAGGGGGGGATGVIFTLRALTYPTRCAPFTDVSLSHDPRSTSNVIGVLAGMLPIASAVGVGRITVLSMVIPFIPSPPASFPVQQLRPASFLFDGSLPLLGR